MIDWTLPVASFDFETDGLDPQRGARPFVMGMAFEDGEVLVAEPGSRDWDLMVGVIGDPAVAKTAHNKKFELKMCAQIMGFEVGGVVHDSMIMAQLLDEYEKSLKLERLAERYIGGGTDNEKELSAWKKKAKKEYKEKFGREPTYRDIPRSLLLDYLRDDVVSALKLFYVFRDRVRDNFDEVYEWELRLPEVLAAMESRGLRVDLEYCGLKRRELHGIAHELLLKLKGDTDNQSFNPSSWQQVAKYMKTLGVTLETNAKGNPKTDADTLEKYDLEFTRDVVSFRKVTKLENTYFGGFLAKQNGSVLRCSFWQSMTSSDKAHKTARLACSDPNLQNVPARDSVTVRRAFVPREGCSLWFFDYAQIELVIFASQFKVRGMLAAMRDGEHVHEHVARQLVGLSRDQMAELKETDKRRHEAVKFVGKQFNFAKVYCAGWRRITETVNKYGAQFGVKKSHAEVRALLRVYDDKFPEVSDAVRMQERELHMMGFVRDWYGRRYRVPAHQSYKAVNAIIQGAAATVMKRALVRVHGGLERLREWTPPWVDPHGAPAIVLTVHDEIVVEVDDAMATQVVKVVKKEMACDDFDLPVEVDVNFTGTSWADKRPASEFGG